MVRPAITAAIIARDEAQHLGKCLAGLAWADERLVILDDRTTDRSAEIAAMAGACLIRRPFQSFPAQRNFALGQVSSPWLLFVDADERVTPALAEEIRDVVTGDSSEGPVGYWIPRRNYIWGGWIRHGGWFPDRQLRLLKVEAAHYDDRRDVHELVKLTGVSGVLSEMLIHYNYDRVQQFIAKQGQYSTLDAKRLARSGQRVKPRNFVLQPLRELRRRLFELEGYKDGWRGFVLASLLALYTGVTYAKLARDLPHISDDRQPD
ncbi:MAG TPA: glycosyltransferase family 2 protein [Chloroflexota bacterium]|nr:glycosyltransferase family 2 protein [Chloroflexota bacterium]